MKSILTSFFVFISVSLFAQFSGYFDPANWTTIHSGGDAGSVDASGAPASITLHSSDHYGGYGTNVRYEITIQICGQVSFDWYFVSNDSYGSLWDPAGYTLNGNYYQLTTDCFYGCHVQSGNATISVAPGDIFGFYAASVDNIFGASHMTISNFSAPDAVCYGDNGEEKVELCHNGVSICVGTSAAAAHMAHGDVLGTCEENAACEENPAFTSIHGSESARTSPHVTEEISIQSRSIAVINAIEVYPNPATDVINIKSGRIEGPVEISIYSISGQLVKQESKAFVRGVVLELNVSDLPNGSYTIKISPPIGNVFNEKLLIQRN